MAPAKPKTRLSAIGILGELLILAGLLLGLYVVWQLFYTDVQAGRAQDEVLDSLDWAVTDDALGGISAAVGLTSLEGRQ